MNAVITMLSTASLALALGALSVGSAAACPGGDKQPSLSATEQACPGGDKTPSLTCPGGDKTPSACPGGDKQPS